ncbi:response regulator [Xanthomonas campestris pv. incanae]|uniref:response regulator n=1 Tax=Xanthomonas campestris TaxID=339 RepID=UPI0029C584F1|nr:response regulator [Xanthomonas campestris]MDX6083881.1 response regulator [Xanthomonas campestris pv. incanae]MDX6141532.1 response regulator [Xanthomonas campestris pv. incanae]
MSESKGQPLVLLAEDDAAMRELAVIVLEEYGCKVIAVPDARMALEVAYLHPSLDLIVSDVFMPGPVNGYDMTRELREKQMTVPVILMSGWTELPGELPDKTKFLLKPYNLASLFESMDEFLNSNQRAS